VQESVVVFRSAGIASVAFGRARFRAAGIALFVLSMFFAASDSGGRRCFNLAGALGNRQKDGWWILLLIGILGVVVAAGRCSILRCRCSRSSTVAIQAIALGVFHADAGLQGAQGDARASGSST